MSFVDQLRSARSSPIATYHEFKIDYVPGSGRLYAFFEGHDDQAFYVTFLQRFVDDPRLIRTYRCGNKRRVFSALAFVDGEHPGAERVLFFVDKDLSDILGEVWPLDDRLFTTEFYSIENYLVSELVADRAFRELIRTNGVQFDPAVILEQFASQLSAFHHAAAVLMAWTVACRRAGLKPNVNNIDLGSLIHVTDDLRVQARRTHQRLAALERVTGVPPGAVTWRDVRRELEALRERAPKSFVRGKFEAWFFLTFMRRLEAQLRRLAAEVGGSVAVRTVLSADNFSEVLSPRVLIPEALAAFLEQRLAA